MAEVLLFTSSCMRSILKKRDSSNWQTCDIMYLWRGYTSEVRQHEHAIQQSVVCTLSSIPSSASPPLPVISSPSPLLQSALCSCLPNATILETLDAENFSINLQLTANGWLSCLLGGMSYELFKEVSGPLSGNASYRWRGMLGALREKEVWEWRALWIFVVMWGSHSVWHVQSKKSANRGFHHLLQDAASMSWDGWCVVLGAGCGGVLRHILRPQPAVQGGAPTRQH